MKDLFDLGGRVAVVTGSTKGIGKAIAEAMAAHGAKLVISSRKSPACERVASQICEAGGEAIAIPCNVSHKDQLQHLVDETRRQLGAIDILVANAGVNPFYGGSLEIPDSAFEKILDVNVRSNHWLCQMVIPEMRERRAGVVIIVSSVTGLKGSGALGSYAISKAADMQLVRNLAVEFGPDGIRANCIAPGVVKTDFARALWEDPQAAERQEAWTPLRRLGIAEDIAGAAVFLAARAGAWLTGQSIVIDGGASIVSGAPPS
jgi:NAD(P)-dependent dehydrogenase (short-subunit alcohol dehydrogenase family)